MLTDRELIEINDKNPAQPLSPFLRESIGSPSYGLSSHGYDIRLSDEWHFSIYGADKYSKNGWLVIDPLSKDFKEQVKKGFSFCKSDSINLHPGEFVLAASKEVFDIPDNIAMELKDKSTLARLGLQVFNTISECGWKGRLVIEIYNNSKSTIMLHAGMGIAQAVFHRLNVLPLRTYNDRKGKYQNQGLKGDQVTLAL